MNLQFPLKSPEDPVGWFWSRGSHSGSFAWSNLLSCKIQVQGRRTVPQTLYLLVHQPQSAAQPDGVNEAIIEQGREVGLLARQVF
jgi:hypothetical protein